MVPQIGTRVLGNGTRESEQVARLANAWLAQLEADVADLLRRAMAWAQGHAEPLPRAHARDYLQAAGEAQVAAVLRDEAAVRLKQARRDRLDARYYASQGRLDLKGAAKLAQRFGWTPKTLRDLQDACKQAEAEVVMAKQTERGAIAAQEQASKEAERHHLQLIQAYQKAHPTEAVRFPQASPPLTLRPKPTPRKRPGAQSALPPPRPEPPKPNQPRGLR